MEKAASALAALTLKITEVLAQAPADGEIFPNSNVTLSELLRSLASVREVLVAAHQATAGEQSLEEQTIEQLAIGHLAQVSQAVSKAGAEKSIPTLSLNVDFRDSLTIALALINGILNNRIGIQHALVELQNDRTNAEILSVSQAAPIAKELLANRPHLEQHQQNIKILLQQAQVNAQALAESKTQTDSLAGAIKDIHTELSPLRDAAQEATDKISGNLNKTVELLTEAQTTAETLQNTGLSISETKDAVASQHDAISKSVADATDKLSKATALLQTATEAASSIEDTRDQATKSSDAVDEIRAQVTDYRDNIKSKIDQSTTQLGQASALLQAIEQQKADADTTIAAAAKTVAETNDRLMD